jgi:hypothetical protein
MIYLILIAAIICTGILSYIIFLSLKRINQLEQLILDISNIIDYISNKIQIIDSKGHFEADDEVGFFFTEIKKITKILNNLFIQPAEDDNAKEKS